MGVQRSCYARSEPDGRVRSRVPSPDLRRPIIEPVVTIQLNGEHYELPAPLSVDDLLARLDIDGRRVAVEVNEFVVKKAAYADTMVRDGDAVEVVNFVGGG
jgi:sulfur carrier protein